MVEDGGAVAPLLRRPPNASPETLLHIGWAERRVRRLLDLLRMRDPTPPPAGRTPGWEHGESDSFSRTIERYRAERVELIARLAWLERHPEALEDITARAVQATLDALNDIDIGIRIVNALAQTYEHTGTAQDEFSLLQELATLLDTAVLAVERAGQEHSNLAGEVARLYEPLIRRLYRFFREAVPW